YGRRTDPEGSDVLLRLLSRMEGPTTWIGKHNKRGSHRAGTTSASADRREQASDPGALEVPAGRAGTNRKERAGHCRLANGTGTARIVERIGESQVRQHSSVRAHRSSLQ